MRLFTFIWAIYLVLLTVVPCCAFDNCEDEPTATAQSQPSEKGSSSPTEKKGCCGCCSPFFCQACGVFIASESISFQCRPIIESTPVFCVYIQPYFPKVFTALWQPPDNIV